MDRASRDLSALKMHGRYGTSLDEARAKGLSFYLPPITAVGSSGQVDSRPWPLPV